MSALARVCDTFAEHVQGLGRTSLAGIADIWKIHSFSTVAPRTPVSINHLSKMHKDPLNPSKMAHEDLLIPSIPHVFSLPSSHRRGSPSQLL